MQFFKALFLTGIPVSIVIFTSNLAHAAHRENTIHIQHIEQVSNTRCNVHYSNGVALEKDCEKAIREHNQQLERKEREREEVLREREREWEERHRECQHTRGELGEAIGRMINDHRIEELSEELGKTTCR